MLVTGDAAAAVPVPAIDPIATTVQQQHLQQQQAATMTKARAPATLADRLSEVAASSAGESGGRGLSEVQLVASSSLDLDIPVMKASSSASLLQAALLVLAVPAMIFAGAWMLVELLVGRWCDL